MTLTCISTDPGVPEPGTESDRDLAARFARDTLPLFGVLHRGARPLTRNDADADDLLQDTLLHAYSGFRSFRTGTKLQAWMFRIMYNRWINNHRGRQRRPTEVGVEEITNWDLARAAAHQPAGLSSGEAVVLADLRPRADGPASLPRDPHGGGSAVEYDKFRRGDADDGGV